MIFFLVVLSLFFLARRLMRAGSLLRLGTFGFLSILAVHSILRWLPHTTYAEALALTAVCLVSLVGLGGMIYHDHQQEGGITRGQEEILLIAVTALGASLRLAEKEGLNTDQHCLFGNGKKVWLTLSMAWRLTGGDFIGSDAAGSVTAPQPSRAVDRSYGTSRRLSDTGCIPGSGKICVVEEWYW